ncbi:type II toxin-antitoxin system PemK/MazF family toxin [Nocardia implantans]|uniref:Type II toxin-antitoxin system PemK/MazF family toxin n=1 Tax=Nocardia implantans TaxID=3108168 RepID=A0ABU6AQ06_9NOCA|nr:MULTISPECIES: type II toxin-antitoxin system PemK/MazF family toxin [unclassified Nocardia]MBF6189893.1 type II toxin-antitoxin system PemK/MazF family toxin [Nocardia beijingensis]MEA3526872.1 type II toxin-antitoxin system PemK/MazF family toxin [Nocardia sp. CDC192]MEB3509550.1 type II toxin-antitoxin system PemK/MazF family toxin [Nocardia sp. CDC186]
MARSWNSLGKQIGLIAKQQGPKIVKQQGPRLVDRLVGSLAQRRTATGVAVRPAASTPVPTAERARQIVYSPQLDGRADPGEIVWTWVPFEEDPSNGKDRPVLVVGRDRRTLLGLMLSSNPERAYDRNWIGIGSGSWDHDNRPSWVRLDRVLDVPEAGIRREGAILPRKTFDLVAHRLCAEYSWH